MTPQPAKALITASGRTIKDVAAEVGVNAHYLGRVLNGYVEPWPALRASLSTCLGVPESGLFAPDIRHQAGHSRIAQGLPLAIEDVAALRRVATILLTVADDHHARAS